MKRDDYKNIWAIINDKPPLEMLLRFSTPTTNELQEVAFLYDEGELCIKLVSDYDQGYLEMSFINYNKANSSIFRYTSEDK